MHSQAKTQATPACTYHRSIHAHLAHTLYPVKIIERQEKCGQDGILGTSVYFSTGNKLCVSYYVIIPPCSVAPAYKREKNEAQTYVPPTPLPRHHARQMVLEQYKQQKCTAIHGCETGASYEASSELHPRFGGHILLRKNSVALVLLQQKQRCEG